MDAPELYVKENGMQRRDVFDITGMFLEKMKWKPNEIILDLGCGPGDVTSNILHPLLKDKIEQMIGVDKSVEMVNYARKYYKCSKMDFKLLDIENAIHCADFPCFFDKIFSFFCFHWVGNKIGALANIHSMLKPGGEILVYFMLTNPLFELYKLLDEEWQKYIKNLPLVSQKVYSQDEIKCVFTKAGFRIVYIESSVKKYTFPDFPSVLNATKAVDEMYSVLPTNYHDKYFEHVKDTILQRNFVSICPSTGKTTTKYLPITIHAVKE